MNPADQWTEEQLAKLAPDETAIRLAKTFAVGWATGDRQLMDTAITGAHTTGRELRFLGAFAEWITQGLNLRHNVAALQAVREEIAQHIANENRSGATPSEGDSQ